MRKQYRVIEKDFYRSYLYLYHDGEEVSVNLYTLLEIYDEIEGLESYGYTRGYTKEEVELAKQDYEHKVKNLLGKSIVKEKIFPRCDKCIKWRYCSRDRDNENNCPDYKRDPPDGGSY